MLPSLLSHLNIPTELSLHLTVSGLMLLSQQSSWSPAVAYPDTGKVVEQLLYRLHWNFTFCSSGGFYFTSHIQDKGFGTLYKNVETLVPLTVVVKAVFGM